MFKTRVAKQLLFTFLVPIFIPLAQAEPKVLAGENYSIFYETEGTTENDVKIAKESVENGFICLKTLYPYVAAEPVIRSTNLKLTLFNKKTDQVNESAAVTSSGTTNGQLSTYYANVQMLNLSAHQKPGYTLLGAPYDNTYFYRIFVHEFAAPIFDVIARKRGGWGFFAAPDWFVQGIEEFTSSMCLGSPSNNEALTKYRSLAKTFFAQNNQNPYVIGVSKITFFVVKFGLDRLNSLITNNKVSFEKAFEDTTGETLKNFEANWISWLQE